MSAEAGEAREVVVGEQGHVVVGGMGGGANSYGRAA